MSRMFEIDKESWQVLVQQPSTAGWRASGEYDVQSHQGGLWFFSDTGRRFLAMEYPRLPTDDELENLPRAMLLGWFEQAEPR